MKPGANANTAKAANASVIKENASKPSVTLKPPGVSASKLSSSTIVTTKRSNSSSSNAAKPGTAQKPVAKQPAAKPAANPNAAKPATAAPKPAIQRQQSQGSTTQIKKLLPTQTTAKKPVSLNKKPA